MPPDLRFAHKDKDYAIIRHMSTKCRYCGSVSDGSGCYHSPAGKHEK